MIFIHSIDRLLRITALRRFLILGSLLREEDSRTDFEVLGSNDLFHQLISSIELPILIEAQLTDLWDILLSLLRNCHCRLGIVKVDELDA
jgi:hypothetical protein